MEEKFKTILSKYLTHIASKKENTIVDQFVDQLQQGVYHIKSKEIEQQLKAQFYHSLLNQTIRKRKRKKNKILFSLSIITCLLLGGTSYFYFNTIQEKTYYTINQPTTIELEDHTLVTLYPSSNITVTQNYNENDRTINLTGKAFFQVTKDSLRPFIVQSSKFKTTVLGTSFLVDDTTELSEVKVKTGKVKVNIPNQTDYVILYPNEKVMNLNNHLTKYNATNEQLSTNTAILQMNDTSFEHWKQIIESEFNIRIYTKNSQLQYIKITGDYRNSSLNDILDSFCFINNLSYSINNNVITIN
ncbi:MAG: FecR family protein [Flavobacteriaceae bacterium]|jgi:ferric-dicitrate binding protein FerR (iron transport regulator)|nr:FecR family protein [Flavobacteriaceae bacterium]